MKQFFADQNLFSKEKGGIEFDSFKKMFFPQHYIVQDDGGEAADKEANDIKKAVTKLSDT